MAVSRFEAEQGDVVRLRVRFERNGSLFDPFAITKVEVRRDTGATTSDLVATIPAGSVVQEAQGIFYVDYAIAADEQVGPYIDRWFFERDAGDAEESDDARFAILPEGSVTPAVGGYISVAEIKSTYLPGTLLTDADIEILIDQATEIVNYYTGNTFGEVALTFDVDGTGQPWLILPETIIDITSISSTCDVDLTEYDISKFVFKGRWIVSKSHIPYPYDRCGVEWFVCGCSGGDIFPRGQKNIRVVGTFGLYPNVPELIRKATGLLVMYGGRDDNRTAPMAYNFSSESVEQHSYSLRELSTLSQVHIKGSTGIVEVDHILNMFRKIRGRVHVI